MLAEAIEKTMATKKDLTRIALIEQSNHYTQIALDRMEKKLDLVVDTIEKNNIRINTKIEKLENKIENRFKWLFNNLIVIFFSSTGLAMTIYEIWKKM